MISVRKLPMLALGNQLSISQATQAHQSVGRPQPRVAPAESDLQSLGDEFDLANSAAAKFNVEAFLFPFALHIDLLFREPHIPERVADTNVAAKDAVTDAARKPRIERERAGRSARTNQGL